MKFLLLHKHKATPVRRVAWSARSSRGRFLSGILQLFLGLILSSSVLRAQDCIDYGEYVHLAGSVGTPAFPFGVVVGGRYAYVADAASGLQVVDISIPTSPTIVGSVDTPGDARGVAVAGSYAYVADHFSGLQVVDISTPTSPAIIGSVDTPGSARGVAVAGNYAYVADYASGLQVVDISSPTSPTIVGSADTPGFAFGLAVAGNYAYVADRDSGLQVLPVQCEIMTPVQLGNLEATPEEAGIQIRWQVYEGLFTGFVILRAAGLNPPKEAYQVLNPEQMVPGEGPWKYLDRDVVPEETYAYKIVGLLRSGGLETFGPVFATAFAPPFALLPASPNPARGETILRFDLPSRDDIQLVVYDVAGRQVRQLLQGPAQAGRNVAPWDGLDDRGHPVASGIYFIRLTWPKGTATTRVSLLP